MAPGLLFVLLIRKQLNYNFTNKLANCSILNKSNRLCRAIALPSAAKLPLSREVIESNLREKFDFKEQLFTAKGTLIEVRDQYRL